MNKNLFFLAVCCLFFVNCKEKVFTIHKRFFRMDTITDITLVVKDKSNATSLWNSIDSILVDWEQKYSIEKPNSEVKKLNERKDSVMPVDPRLKDMIRYSLAYGDTLDGGFDITILPVKVLWGFGENADEDPTIPSREEVSSALKKVDYKKVHLRGDSVYFSSPETRIDVGGIAKGYALREVASFLDIIKIENFLICAGGDIVVKGKRADGDTWRVGIQHPRKEGMVGAFEMDSGTVVTSGDYERFRMVNGRRYHHIFDSKTGYSVNANQSVTIYGRDPVEVDIFSTGLFGRSASEIIDFVNKRERLECFVVDSAGEFWVSDGWKNKIELMN